MATRVVLDPAQLTVEPGAEAVCTVRVRNDGTVVDEFVADVVGEVLPWAIAETDSVRLFPGDEGAIVLHLRPPRTHRLIPGTIPFGVRVVATSAGDGSAVVEEGGVHITAFHEVQAVLTPRRSRARITGRHRVTVTNHGNVSTEVRLTGSDPDDVLDVRFRKPAFELAAGAVRRVRTLVRPATLSLNAGTEPHQFQVAVEADEVLRIDLDGAIVVRSVVPAWVPIAVAVLVAAIVLLVGLLRRESVQTLATTGSLGAVTPNAAAVPASGSGGKAAADSAAAGGGGAARSGGTAAASGPAAATPAAPGGGGLSAIEASCLAGTPVPRGSRYPADGTALDAGPDHQDGTLTGATGYAPGPTGAGSDQAFSMTGGTSGVDLGRNVGELGAAGFCVELAVDTTARVPQALLGNRRAADGVGSWDIRLQSSGMPYAELGSVVVPGYAAVNDGAWHHICLIRSDALVNLYVDRRLVGTANTVPPAGLSDGAATHLGWDGFLPFTGSIDGVVVVRG
ncbi:MAG TPA: LamG-like jellyroll fold domain-containing protein [Candidatus Dormibacteraeota bacterium]